MRFASPPPDRPSAWQSGTSYPISQYDVECRGSNTGPDYGYHRRHGWHVVARVQRQQRLDARRAHRDLGDVCWLRQGTTQTHTRQRSWREVEEGPVEEELFFLDMRSQNYFYM